MEGNEMAAEAAPKMRDVITSMLADAGCANPAAWEKGLHPDVDHAHPSIQQFHCTNQWGLILGQMPNADTRFLRYCLNESGNMKNWFQSFEVGVVPLLLNGGVTPEKKAAEPAMAG